jgi:hypothetical protein
MAKPRKKKRVRQPSRSKGSRAAKKSSFKPERLTAKKSRSAKKSKQSLRRVGGVWRDARGRFAPAPPTKAERKQARAESARKGWETRRETQREKDVGKFLAQHRREVAKQVKKAVRRHHVTPLRRQLTRKVPLQTVREILETLAGSSPDHQATFQVIGDEYGLSLREVYTLFYSP